MGEEGRMGERWNREFSGCGECIVEYNFLSLELVFTDSALYMRNQSLHRNQIIENICDIFVIVKHFKISRSFE